jgi:hypothetical protein
MIALTPRNTERRECRAFLFGLDALRDDRRGVVVLFRERGLFV